MSLKTSLTFFETYLQLQLRCGWGSGALYFAEILPHSNITAFSNSRTQKLYIDEKAKEKGLENLTVITGNVVDYEFEKESFDRVVSIEVSRIIILRERGNLLTSSSSSST